MTPSHANKGGVRYRYYVSRALAEGRRAEAGEVARVSAPDLERIVLEAIRRETGCGRQPADARRSAERSPDEQRSAERPADLELIDRHLRRVAVHGDRLAIVLSGQAKAGDQTADAEPQVTLTIPWSPPSARPRREVVMTDKPADTAGDAPQLQLIAAIVKSHSWMQELISGTVDSIDSLANREGKHPRSIRAALSFAFLAPDIVERLVAGTLPRHLTLTDIGRGLPLLWSAQRRMMAG